MNANMAQTRIEFQSKKVMAAAVFAALSIGLSGCIHPCQYVTAENLHSFSGCKREGFDIFGMRPLQPAFTVENRFPSVRSLTPTLEWEPSSLAPGSGDISNVRYDLAIWKGINPRHAQKDSFVDGRFSRGNVWISVDSLALAYERDGLTGTSHAVETALEPRTDYAWSVRARFDVNGQTRVGEWSLVNMPEPVSYVTHGGNGNSSRNQARRTGQLPPYALYYFRTPGR